MAERKHSFESRENWRSALNAKPNSKWIKVRNLGGTRKSEYLPLAVQQALADVFFDEFDVLDAKYQVVVNEILCTVRISVLPSHPNAEHRIISGTGAKPIQMASGGTPKKFPEKKIINSLEYCAPASRSSAISNALTTFGNVFGRQLGRKDVSKGFNLNDNKRKKNAGK